MRDEKATTKLQIVFDASAKANGSHNLNDCLYPRPSITATLFVVLLRFRIHNIAFVGDIERTFLQIGLHPSHRGFVRLLWFQEPSNIDFENFENNELTELRFCRVLFGVTSSPFLLFATIIHHMNKYSTVDKEFVDRFLSSLHVDDLSTGANSVDEAFDYFCKCKDRLEVGSFNLRKFRSNSAELEQMVNKNYGMLTEEHNCLIKNKILGLQWDKLEDDFVFDFTEIPEKFDVIPTKRNVIKAIASIYDPLGLLNPIVVHMKKFFQRLCSAKYGWDDLITNDYLEEWNELVKFLSAIEFIRVPRLYCCYHNNDLAVTIELHGFCEATQ